MAKAGSRVTIIDKGWNRIRREVEVFKNSFTKVGLFSDGAVRDGMSIVMIGVVNEFGTQDGRILPRPFIRGWTDQNRAKINAMILKLYQGVIIGKFGAKKAIGILGEWATGEIKKFITDLKIPENAASTIRIKGFDNPLIHTGIMRSSITHKDTVK